MADVYGYSVLKYFRVAKWSVEYRFGQDSFEDDPRPGHPDDGITQEMIDRVARLVQSYSRIKVAKLASECGISNGSDTIIDIKYLPGGYPETKTHNIVSKGRG